MKHNKLIAEFMGVGKHYEAQSSNMFNQYHTDWNKLIPVAQRLIDVYISIDEQDEQDLQQSILHNRIGVVYQIVVELIKLYKNES